MSNPKGVAIPDISFELTNQTQLVPRNLNYIPLRSGCPNSKTLTGNHKIIEGKFKGDGFMLK